MNKTGKNLMAIVMTLIIVITALPVTSLFTAEQVMAADSQSVTVTDVMLGEPFYERHTGNIISGNKYLIVSGNGNNSHLLTNNSGAVDDTTVNISNGTITGELDNEANVLWTFTASGNDYKISNNGYYIPLNTNTLSFSESNTDNVIVEVRTDGYWIHRTEPTEPGGINRRLRYSNSSGWGISRNNDYTLNLYEKSIAGQTVALTLTPFVTDLTSKGATSTISKTVKIGDSAASSYDLTWSSSDPDTVTVDENGKVTGIARGSAMITATLTKVNETDLETPLSASVKVNVEYSLPGEPGTNNREYPSEGSVRINKTASSDRMDFDGLSQVELDVAGVGLRPGVDVVLIVDVSNSMGWNINRSGNGTSDADKVPRGDEKTKLHDAMVAADSFAKILLEGQADGRYANSVSFVTFAGYDKERSVRDSDHYRDSVMTVFTNETDYNRAANVFSNTDISYNNYQYTLKINGQNGDYNGANRGNTNYDYAFAQASEAVDTLQNNYTQTYGSYAHSGRETYVIFMTDGAPSHYNGETFGDSGSSNRDKIPGSNNTYVGDRYNASQDTWTNYFTTHDNSYAVALYNKVGGNLYAIGFDLAHGGFTAGVNSVWQWTEDTLKGFLEGMVKQNTGKTIPVEVTADSDELREFYENLAHLIKPAGTEAQVIDTVNTEDFTVQLANSVPLDIAGENSTHSFDPDHTGLSVPNMQVKTYTLYTASTCGGDTTKIGKRTGETEVLETVTFYEEGSEAYSDQINNGTTNIMTIAGGVTTINGRYFTYTKDENTLDEHNNPTEKFVWNIGDIPDKEIAFSFYVYLKGSMEGTRTTTGAVYTNIEATLDYIDIDGDHVHDVFPQPVAVWKDAVTEIEFYLVDDEGYPVNHAGQRISRAVRVRVGDITKTEFPVNHSEDEAHEVQIQAAHYLPEGYELYNPDAYYKVRAVSHKDLGSFLTISDSASPQTTFDVLEEEGTYTDVNRDLKLATHVAFGVKLSSIPGRQLVKDVAVIDYAKPIDIDILANDKENIPTGYTAAFEGYKAYANNTDMTKMYPVDSEHSPAASDTPEAGSGTFSKATSGTKTLAHYVLNKFFNTVDKTFGVVLFENKNNTTDKYYMYNEIDVMPANNIYYEDDFAIGNDSTVGFVYTGTWTTDGSVSGNKETPNNAVHGGWISEDPGLSTDDGYGDGSAHKTVTPGAKVTFNFTGTGVDVYTRTNTDSGKVRAYLYKVADGKETLTTILFVDNYAKSGDYYQIPTLSINDLEYGTYKLELTAGSVNGTRKTYYIDGIRVYNPIQNLESDSVVSKAYGENELDATFTNARELLKDGSMAFIDQIYHLYYTPSGGTKTVVTESGEAIELPNGGVYDEDLGILVDVSGEAIKDKAGRTISIAKESGDVKCVITGTAITLTVPSGCEIGTEANGEAVADYTESAMGKVAPANEVYLDKGQSVIVQTTNGAKGYYLGIKMLDGESTVSVSYGSEQKVITVDHTTDLYYKVIPDSDGQIVISNTGTGDSGKIAITKLRIAGAPAAAAEPQQNLAPINTQAAPTKLAAFRALPLVYEVAGAAAEEPTEPDTIETEIGEDDIVIENPDNFVEPEDESLAGIESVAGAKDNKSSVKSMLDWLVKALFGSIRSLFA